MTEYGKDCLREYLNALIRAERLIRDSEHDMWMVDEVNDLYDISRSLREALSKVAEGLSQKMYEKQQREG
jgi:hypothetical protein